MRGQVAPIVYARSGGGSSVEAWHLRLSPAEYDCESHGQAVQARLFHRVSPTPT